ncbi:non-ribosomal peptide synthetase [Herpetosiphon sp.]|uniref:Amino acid adenylation domain n=1 Tax=Herpetosiphon aurantiacus (strain ATCC 23779 / DSM 785 / 114-95) TaxID=316274 RepID=A9B5X1_HERA2|nr:non-ribosomal peptide synthetase [Herpetosiphon sp.]ABX05764.1 amino acid adenylation domain [Herpetosiphon aurantiacus DSM 785]
MSIATLAPITADRTGTVFVHDVISTHAQHSPQAIAIATSTFKLSYAEFEQRTNQLAHYLHRQGVHRGHTVGACFERSVEAMIAAVAIWKAGAVYLPLDPGYPQERLKYMLGNSGASLVLATQLTASQFPEQQLHIFEQLAAELAQQPSHAPEHQLTPDDLAYIIYTSGSTGKPKGVLVPHRGLANLAAAQTERFGINSQSRILQFASPSFDASISEMLTAFFQATTLFVAPTNDLLPGPDLLTTLRDHHITVATLPPSVLALLDPRDLPNLQTIVSAGEACTAEIVARWGTNRRFINAYGPTEVTVCATMSQSLRYGMAVSIGNAISNSQTYIVDEHLNLVEGEAVGELLVSSVGLAHGYLGLGDQTAERFLPNPWSDQAGSRMYRTGDLVRRLSDGSLEFRGRIDHQIKHRGYRIDPGEIEMLLMEYPNVRHAVVTLHHDHNQTERLVSYLVLHGEVMPYYRDIYRYLESMLPKYMVPLSYTVVKELPRTPNGKLDLAALPEPDFALLTVSENYVAPRTPLEQQIAAIWENILDTPNIGVLDDFFDAGGHSLLATQIVSAIRSTFAVEIPLSVLLGVEPTIAATAQLIEQYQIANADDAELADLLNELDGLSDEEIQALLADEGALTA